MLKRFLSILLSLMLAISCMPLSASASQSDMIDANAIADATISIESTYCIAGSTVSVNINIANNPGIAGAKFTVSFGNELTLVAISEENGAFEALDYTSPESFTSPCPFNWDSLDAVSNSNGTILTLTFEVSSSVDVNEQLDISLSYNFGDIYNADLDSLTVTMVSGVLNVIDYTPGDVNDDGVVNGKDVTLIRRLNAGAAIDINMNAADVNDDGVINGKDVTLIRRYNAGYDIKLLPATPKCGHTMEATTSKAATCTENGNKAYWYCSSCGKYFSDANGATEITLADTVIKAPGHTVVIDPGKEPTYDEPGLTEGKHCSVCGIVFVAQEEIPILERDQYYIYYHVTENDTYLQALDSAGQITNENPATYTETDTITLLNLSVPGYIFDGWYDGAGSNATQIKKIENQTGTVHLYAHWTLVEYTVQFDAPLVPVAAKTFTVNTGLTLNDPDELPGYVFMGWSDAEGNLVTRIPEGTAQSLTLYGNWTSARNQTRPKEDLGTPIIHIDEESNQIFFVYEIGTIVNVPLYELKYIGNMMEGVEITETVTKAVTVDETSAKEISQAISNATTNTSAWTLSNEWTSASSISESHLYEMDSSISANLSAAYSQSGTYNISTSEGGSTTTAIEAGVSAKIGTKTSTEASVGFPVDVVDVGAKVSTEVSTEVGAEVSASASDTKTWNTNEGYSASRAASMSKSLTQTLAEKISNSVTYDVSNAATESTSNSQSTATTATDSREYAAAFTYSTAQIEENTYTVALKNAPAGYYRMVCAGTAHVFAVVTYDIATRSYGVFTYSIMEDQVRPFLDYSKTSANFDDNENGVLPFEVPYFVNNYVDSIVGASDGLKVDEDTGIITGYIGNDEIVVFPQYLTVEDGDKNSVVKINGFASNVFAGNTTVKAVQICENITEIPDGAFQGCTSLVMVQAPAVTTIGANAFAGCSSLKDYTVSTAITSLGINAFADVGKVTVNASCAAVADAAVNSGAKNIVLNLANLSDALTAKTYNVSAATESFTLNGAGTVCSGVQIVSDAQSTAINNVTFADNTETPLIFSSSSVKLNKVTASASGVALRLTAELTSLGLQGKVSIVSTGGNAAIVKSVQLYESNSSTTGTLIMDGNLLVSGTVDGEDLISFARGQIIYIDDDNPVVVTFDPNGGTIAEASRLVYGGTAVGELPVPTRDYYTFDGWFTSADGGDQITPDTIVAVDSTVYAHWTLNEVSGWILASEMPSDAQLVNEKWTYTETTTTESRETSLAGYTQIGSYWVKSSSGSFQYSDKFSTYAPGFDTSHSIYKTLNKSPYSNYENETQKREVSTSWAGYVYWHWMYDCGGAGAGNRAIYYQYGTSPTSMTNNNYKYQYFGAFLSATKFTEEGSNWSQNDAYYRWYRVTDRSSNADTQGSYWFYRFDYYTCSYTDYYKMFQYRKVENKESATEIFASDTISNVQKWVQFRAK